MSNLQRIYGTGKTNSAKNHPSTGSNRPIKSAKHSGKNNAQ